MEIRGLSADQIKLAAERASKEYGGNLYIPEVSFRVRRPKSQIEIETRTYTAAASYRVFVRHERFDRTTAGDAVKTGEWEEWEDYGFYPYSYMPGASEDSRLAVQKSMCEEKTESLRGGRSIYGDDVAAEYEVRLVPEHEINYTIVHDTDTEWGVGKPLNKRDDAYSGVLLRVKSAKRIGSRVSQENYYFSRPVRRIASACWHAHRDFMREVFAINPDARIRTALADYRGEDNFELKFPSTAYGGGMAGAANIESIGDACNCDEGDHPEMATEMLTEDQAEFRREILFDMIGDAPYPHGFSQSRANAYENLRDGKFEKVLNSIKRAETSAA